ncbi:hypothetical protein NX059_006052 [Plenodomus lindquistii]|nr:hypothetical protein NX059_006052 [Plenodomus lindquistii]
MQNSIYISSILLAAASPALSQYNPAPGYSPISPPAPGYSAAPIPSLSSAAPTPSVVKSTTPVMPSMTTTKVLTSALTVTSFLTVTTSAKYGAGDIIEPIEKLGQCSQTIIFDCLKDSKCNPADFPCICAELKTHDIDAKITQACPEEKDQYLKFATDVCNNIKPTPGYSVYVTSSAAPPMNTTYPTYPAQSNTYPAKNMTSSAAPPPPPAPSGPPGPPGPPAPSGPVTSVVTVTLTNSIGLPTTLTSTVVGPPVTSVMTITGTNSVGQPTTMMSTVVGPAPTVSGTPSAGPPGPEYTGAAALLNVKNAVLAGGVGLMGLVFAGL